MSEQTAQKALHWLVVGYVSDGAKVWIEEAGGQVKEVSEEPRLVAVGLAYNPKGTWQWYKGRQNFRQGIEFWNTGELQEASTGITLQYGSISKDDALAEYCSVETNYLILPDEEIKPGMLQVKEPIVISVNQPKPIIYDGLEDLGDHPF